jgi:hypothetical protein
MLVISNNSILILIHFIRGLNLGINDFRFHIR